MRILITGGAGYIGSTIASACEDAGHEVVILDDLSAGARAFTTGRAFYEGDIADGALLEKVFADHPGIDAVVHCAAAIVVPESVAEPLRYYDNNVGKTVRLVAHLQRLGCTRLVFSSSASIYVAGDDLTVDESATVAPSSPYATTKAMVETILRDVCATGTFSAISLRYFNPVGADPQLRTGLQTARPTHALGKLIEAYENGVPFTITGTDWPTRDGSAIRDYIHVWDLARAHVAALERFDDVVSAAGSSYEVINVGTGDGTTVRELVAAFEAATGGHVEVVEGPSRPGDVIGCYSLTGRATRELGWRAELSIEQAIKDALAWAQRREAVLAGRPV